MDDPGVVPSLMSRDDLLLLNDEKFVVGEALKDFTSSCEANNPASDYDYVKNGVRHGSPL